MRGLWRSLTGQQQEVERTVVRGFHTAMAKVPAGDPHLAAFDIMHGERLVLVDSSARIRGYYPADDSGLVAILRAARALAAR